MRVPFLFAALLAMSACTGMPGAPADLTSVTITAEVPNGTGPVYLSGNLESLGPWAPDALPMSGEGRIRKVSVSVPYGHTLEYKFTLGTWDREALGPSGMVMANFILPAGINSATHVIEDFKKDPSVYIATPSEGGVLGELIYWLDQPSAFLSENRHVTIWLPPGYEADPAGRYRVIYMSDGQNLFDPRIANTGTDWGADEAMVNLAGRGIDPAIIVSTWSTSLRGREYSPWHDAPNYARFLIEELMPRVNSTFRTRTGPENTSHAGSSMGGLLSFYLVTHHPEVFGACGCVSTHFPLSEEIAIRFLPGIPGTHNPDKVPYILRDIEGGLKPPQNVRYRFDHGSLGLDAHYAPTHAAVAEWLESHGLIEGQEFVVVAHAGADHNESSWRRQLPEIFEFLLAPRQDSAP